MFNLGRFWVLIFLVLLISQRFPTDRAYFIAKELLTTERTYVKDLEVVTVVRGDGIVSPVCVFGLALYSVEENIDYSALLLRRRTPVKTETQGRFGPMGLFQLSLNFSFRFSRMFPFPCDSISAEHVDVMQEDIKDPESSFTIRWGGHYHGTIGARVGRLQLFLIGPFTRLINVLASWCSFFQLCVRSFFPYLLLNAAAAHLK